MSHEESKNHSNKLENVKSDFNTTRFLKNAFANIARGGSSALVTILLPPFLTRLLTKDEYGAWLLILQLSAYVNFLDFGIQTAVGRFIAHTTELKDFQQRDKIASTALAILSGIGFIAFLGLLGLTWHLPQLFSSMPQELHQDAQYTLLLIGGSLAIGLPFSIFSGIFIGLQRYDIPAWIIGFSKLTGSILVVLAAQATHNIIWMGACMSVTTLAASLIQYFAFRKIGSEIKVVSTKISWEAGQEICEYCFGLSIWTVGILLVSGLDTTIVGFFDYKSVAYYTLAVSLTNFVVQLQGAIFSTLMPVAAVLSAREDRIGLGKLLVSSTRYGIILLLLTGIPLIFGAKWIITLWVGVEYATNTAILLQVLVIANILRLIGLPYATLVVAAGQQQLILISPVVEGLTNFIASVMMTSQIGAVGAALGTLGGGGVSIAFHLWYNLPRTTKIIVSQKNLIWDGLFRPMFCFLPSITILFLFAEKGFQLSILASVFAVILSFAMLGKYGIEADERQKLISKFYKNDYLKG
jgi:O-antigen/teichoic acid export membrane protein